MCFNSCLPDPMYRIVPSLLHSNNIETMSPTSSLPLLHPGSIFRIKDHQWMEGVSSLDSPTVFIIFSFQQTTPTDLISSVVSFSIRYSFLCSIWSGCALEKGRRSVGLLVVASLIPCNFLLDCLFFYPTYYINTCVLFLYLNFPCPQTNYKFPFYLRLPGFNSDG